MGSGLDEAVLLVKSFTVTEIMSSRQCNLVSLLSSGSDLVSSALTSAPFNSVLFSVLFWHVLNSSLTWHPPWSPLISVSQFWPLLVCYNGHSDVLKDTFFKDSVSRVASVFVATGISLVRFFTCVVTSVMYALSRKHVLRSRCLAMDTNSDSRYSGF
jgi:hypothetical protein